MADYREPEGEQERQVAAIFADVLRAEKIGVDDNFFEIGGNSLLAVQARTRLVAVFGERISLVDLFRFPTVRGLVGALDDGGKDVDLTETKQAANRRVAALRARANRGSTR